MTNKKQQNKLVLYISMSLDGFIATNDDDISWLSMVEKEGEDYGYNSFTNTVGSYVIGRKTYEVVKELCGGIFPQADKFDCYVLTRQDKASENGVTFYNGDVSQLVKKLKENNNGNIYCDGGGEVVKLLMEQDLIDEYIISVIPTILGDGKRLFKGGTGSIALKAQAPVYYNSGLVQLRYTRE